MASSASPARKVLELGDYHPNISFEAHRAAHAVAVPEEILRTNLLPKVASGAGIVGHYPILENFLNLGRAWGVGKNCSADFNSHGK